MKDEEWFTFDIYLKIKYNVMTDVLMPITIFDLWFLGMLLKCLFDEYVRQLPKLAHSMHFPIKLIIQVYNCTFSWCRNNNLRISNYNQFR